MICSSRSVVLSLVAAFALAGCGGGGSGVVAPAPTPTASGVTSAAIAANPGGLQFTTPSSAAQTFTVSSPTSGVIAPTIDSSECTVNGTAIATITGGGGTLPATYTVTPNPSLQQTAGALPGTYGNCVLVLNSGTNVTVVQILVGTNSSGPQTLSASPATLSFAATNASPQTVTVSGNAGTGPGTVTVSGGSCTGIASASGGGGTAPQTFTVAPISAGGCSLVFVDGEASTIVPITVAQATATAALILTPSSLTFAASNSAPQTVNVSYQGYVGQVSVDQSKCAGIATFSIPNSSLPATGTVTPVGKGTCAVTFSPSAAPAVTLSITVQS